MDPLASPTLSAPPSTFVPILTAWLQPLADLVWGWPMIFLLVGTGVWLMIRLHFLPLRQLPAAVWALFGPRQRHDTLAVGTISNRAALWTALAATVGTGNIAGVATAIALGGPGAVFWMWVSGVLGLALKFTETTLGVHYRVKDHDGHWRGGPMHYLAHGARLPILGGIYALALAFAAFSIGGMIQANSIADGLAASFNADPVWVGAAVVALAALIMFGGLTRIAAFANVLVPFMILVFLLVGGLILVLNASYLPSVFAMIVEAAFTPAAAGGGVIGATLAEAMRYGLARGIFSNEAGLGSAAVVSASARTRHPAEQGFIAMTQTFIDTLVICTFTALVILVSDAHLAPGVASGGAALTAQAFDMGLGFLTWGGVPLGGAVISVSLVLFAFTTILGWGYFGQQGAVYLLGPKAAKPYLVVFLLLTFFGAAVLSLAPTVAEGVRLVWLTADVTVAAMLVPNLIALLILGPKAARLAQDWLRHQRTGEALHHPAFHGDPWPRAAASPAPAPQAAIKAEGNAPAKAKPVARASQGKTATRKPKRRR